MFLSSDLVCFLRSTTSSPACDSHGSSAQTAQFSTPATQGYIAPPDEDHIVIPVNSGRRGKSASCNDVTKPSTFDLRHPNNLPPPPGAVQADAGGGGGWGSDRGERMSFDGDEGARNWLQRHIPVPRQGGKIT